MRVYAVAMLLMLGIGILWQRPAIIALSAGMVLVWVWLMAEQDRQGNSRNGSG